MASSRALAARLDALWQQSTGPLFALNSDRRLLYVNRAWEALTGYDADQVQGLLCRAMGPTRPGDLLGLGGSFCPPPEAIQGQPSSTLTLIVAADGERHWRRIEFWPLRGDDGGVAGILGLVREPEAFPLAAESETSRLRVELMHARERLQARQAPEALIGVGHAHRRLLDQVSTAAATTVPALIVGETGTGKRAVAWAIHSQGAGRQAPMVPFDCQALPHDVLGREFMGLVGLEHAREGPRPRSVIVPGSTVVVGDVLDLPTDLQADLARAATGRGRLIATTRGDPDKALSAGGLLPELFYAITGLVLRLPPLRERVDEIPMLAQHFLERANQQGDRQRDGFSRAALDALVGYDWPGNLRELGRVVESAHGRGDGDLVGALDLPASIRGHLGSPYMPPAPAARIEPLDELLMRVERRLIEQALARARQNKSKAADLLGISRPRLYRRIKELDIPDVPEPPESP
ncbi:sigma 54-interacting transcriptional regulator [Isosphaeraceae bacterium EP7]